MFGPLYADHIRTASLTSDYRLQDNFGGTNFLTVNFRQGLDILGASHRGDDYLSRYGASGKFSALNFWYTRYQTITDAWSLKLAAAGQVASGPLFTSQQFYLGGLAFGRGYGSAENFASTRRPTCNISAATRSTVSSTAVSPGTTATA